MTDCSVTWRDDYIVKPFSRGRCLRDASRAQALFEKPAEEDSSIVRLPQLEFP